MGTAIVKSSYAILEMAGMSNCLVVWRTTRSAPREMSAFVSVWAACFGCSIRLCLAVSRGIPQDEKPQRGAQNVHFPCCVSAATAAYNPFQKPHVCQTVPGVRTGIQQFSFLVHPQLSYFTRHWSRNQLTMCQKAICPLCARCLFTSTAQKREKKKSLWPWRAFIRVSVCFFCIIN